MSQDPSFTGSTARGCVWILVKKKTIEAQFLYCSLRLLFWCAFSRIGLSLPFASPLTCSLMTLLFILLLPLLLLERFGQLGKIVGCFQGEANYIWNRGSTLRSVGAGKASLPLLFSRSLVLPASCYTILLTHYFYVPRRENKSEDSEERNPCTAQDASSVRRLLYPFNHIHVSWRARYSPWCRAGLQALAIRRPWTTRTVFKILLYLLTDSNQLWAKLVERDYGAMFSEAPDDWMDMYRRFASMKRFDRTRCHNKLIISEDQAQGICTR